MAPRESPLYKFILNALLIEKYPSCLYWVNKEEKTFCLECISKNKKGWTPMHSRIFEDYHKIKCRKSDDMRQRFLVAMKVCPLINLLKDMSSTQKKYYEFRQPGTLLDGIPHEMDIQLDPNIDEDGQITPVQVCENVDGIMEDSICGSSIENGFGNCVSPLLDDDNALCSPDILEYEGEIDANVSLLNTNENNIEMDLDFLYHKLDMEEFSENEILAADIDLLNRNLQNREKDLTIPDDARSASESNENEADASLFNETKSLRSFSYCQAPDFSDGSRLSEEEKSYSFKFVAENNYFPNDYDPTEDFFQSLKTPEPAEVQINSLVIPIVNPDRTKNDWMVPSASVDSPKYEIAKVSRINANDNLAKLLEQKNCKSGNNPGKDYFMMVLKQKQM